VACASVMPASGSSVATAAAASVSPAARAASIATSTSSAAGGAGRTNESEAEQHHDELFLITGLLDQLRTASSQTAVCELVGPTWLLAPIIRGGACKAAERFVAAVQEFSEDRGTPTPEEIRAAVETAGATAATLIGLDRTENYAVV
jgi:hypothetical protein